MLTQVKKPDSREYSLYLDQTAKLKNSTLIAQLRFKYDIGPLAAVVLWFENLSWVSIKYFLIYLVI